MAKKLKIKVKLQIKAGQANPAPPVGPALGQHGVNIMDFCNKFNEKTKQMGDTIVPVVISIYQDRSFDFITKTPPAAELIKKELFQDKGSAEPNRNKIGALSKEQIKKIAKLKMPDLNANSIEQAEKIVAGTAKSMGVKVEE